VQRATKVGWL